MCPAAGRQSSVLITGGAGFIGSHLAEHLVARGECVTILDDFSTGRRENLRDLRNRPEVRIIDGSVSEAMGALTSGEFDAIYHLAAAVGVRLVIDRPVHTIETNVRETAALLDFAAAASTPTLIASSSEVYGKSTATPFREDDDVVYGPTVFPRWSYACSKAIDEYLALAFHRERQLPVVIARFFNTVGPRQVGRYGMVLPRFVAAALADEPLQVHGDGAQVRCFCDVRDVVGALPRLLAHDAAAGRVFNVGSDQPITIKALAELVRDTLGSRSPVQFIPYEQAFGPGFEDLRCRVPDVTRLREAIGFSPAIGFEQTIRDVAAALSAEGVPPAVEASAS